MHVSRICNQRFLLEGTWGPLCAGSVCYGRRALVWSAVVHAGGGLLVKSLALGHTLKFWNQPIASGSEACTPLQKKHASRIHAWLLFTGDDFDLLRFGGAINFAAVYLFRNVTFLILLICSLLANK